MYLLLPCVEELEGFQSVEIMFTPLSKKTNNYVRLFSCGLLFFVVLALNACKEDVVIRRKGYGRLPVFASDTVWFVVENPAGTLPLMRYDPDTRGFHKVKARIAYLPLPANAGFVPRAGAEDRGAWPNGLLLAEAQPRGKVLKALPLGVLQFRESGHKRALTIYTPLEEELRLLPARTFSDFMIEGEASRRLLEVWFKNHQGYGRISIDGWVAPPE